MYLKSLTLKGFKSFADRTHMVFDPGLTVVVGPNGSGKSNVSDSILWVLGEQSARMLRGQAMEDVIFSGSSARQPVGVAEVTLVLDNSDHTLPVDFDEVGVTRRMYRSGESEYLINGAPARLMDIQDILHDSGLGKETHSIISQGKLDSILQSRPEERRELIEEAAGISKHRRRKERSLRKLKSMDENLRRAKDISREISRQLRPLERQVNKAKRANDISSRLSELTTTLAVDDLRALQREWNDLTARGKESDAELELARYRLDEKKRELEKLQSMLEQKGLFVGDLGEQRRRMQDALGRIDSDMRLLEEKGKNMVDKLSEMRMSLSTLVRQRSEAASELDRSTSELDASKAKFDQLSADVAELGPAAVAARDALRETEGSIAQLNADQHAAQRTCDQETLAYVRLKEQVSNAEVEDSMFESRIAQLDETVATCEEALAERRDRKADIEKSISSASVAAERAAKAISQCKRDLHEASSAEDKARKASSEAKASLAALRSVDSSVEASSPLVASVASDPKASGLIGCRLGDLIETPAELEALVERLLGEDLSALVVADADAQATVADVAVGASGKSGQATVVSRAAHVDRPSAVGHDMLVDHLDVPEDACGLVEALLGDVALVDDVVSAVEAHVANPGLTFVSRDGATVLPDGRCVVVTPAGAETGALERKRRIRSLEDGMPNIERTLSEAQSRVAAARRALSGERDEADRAKGDLARLRGELSSVTSEIGRLEAQRNQAESERAQVAKRRAAAGEKAREAKPKLDAHLKASEDAKAKVASISERVAELEALRSEQTEAESKAAAKLAEARLEFVTTRERRSHLESRSRELSSRLSDLEGRVAAIERSSRSLEVLRLRVDPLHERYDAIQTTATAWAERLRDRASLAEADSDSLKKTIGDAKAQVADAQSAYEAAQASTADVKVAAGRLEVQVETKIQAIVADGAYTLEDALALPEPADLDADEREVASLKRQLADIGPVNQVAMDEYEQLKRRADYIGEQVADLESARGALVKITAAIDRKMRRQFLVTFDKVNSNFEEVFSMLFPGGKDHLEMTDPDHLAETGIEIVAQPRGKRLSKMTLMSGGEKSLTALALLFAVYRTRTVPFYVFDEVEAALDDSNLDKLLGAIEHLKQSTQLIVISHQRRTMEQADVLYGVSMQADGVSHVVSQRLDRATGKVVDA